MWSMPSFSHFTPNKWQTIWQGFGTVGMSLSDSEVTGIGRRKDATIAAYKGEPSFGIDSLLGLQFGVNYDDHFQAVTQLRLRQQHDTQLKDYVQLAFIGYKPHENFDLRGGILPLDTYLQAENMDVAFVNPWVRPPTTFYGLIALDNFKGIDATYRHPLSDGGVIEVRGAAGEFDSTLTISGKARSDITFTNFRSVAIVYGSSDWSARYSYLQANASKLHISAKGAQSIATMLTPWLQRLDPILINTILHYDPTGSVAKQHAIALSWDNGQAKIQAEGSHVVYTGTKDLRSYAAYIGASYTLNDFTPYTVLARTYSPGRYDGSGRYNIAKLFLEEDRDVQYALLDVISPMSGSLSHSTFSLGLRWDLNRKTALKLQWDLHHIGKSYLVAFTPGKKPDRHVNTLAINLDFIF